MLGSASFISFNSHSNTNHIKCNYFALILIQNGDEFRIDNNPKSKFRKVFILQQSSVYALAICRFDDSLYRFERTNNVKNYGQWNIKLFFPHNMTK